MFHTFFDALTRGMEGVSKRIQATFGSGPESVAAGIDLTKEKIKNLSAEITALKNEQGNIPLFKKLLGSSDKYFDDPINKANNKLAALRQELEILEAQERGFKSQEKSKNQPEISAEEKKNAEDRANAQVMIAAKQQQQILQLKLQANQQEQELAITEEQSAKILSERKLLLESEFYNQVRQLQANKDIEDTTRDEMILQMYQNHINAKLALDQTYDDSRKQALNNSVTQSKSALSTVGAAFTEMSKNANEDWKKGTTLAQSATTAFKLHSANAFLAIGEGSKNAGDAMKGFMLGALADIAEAQGRVLLAAVLVNPLNAAAGAALLVLAGFLRSQSGESKASSGLGDVGGGGGGGGGPSSSALESPQMDEKKLQKTVTINVSGSYFDTDQTRTRITELVRESADFTDFKFNTIGLQGV